METKRVGLGLGRLQILAAALAALAPRGNAAVINRPDSPRITNFLRNLRGRNRTGVRMPNYQRGAHPAYRSHGTPPQTPLIHVRTSAGVHKFYKPAEIGIARLLVQTKGGILEHLNSYGQVVSRERFKP